MKKKIFLIVTILIVIGSWIFKTYNINQTTNIVENNFELKEEQGIPTNFTIEKIKIAFLEYINYRLWFSPYEYYYIGDPSDTKQLENHINRVIDAEIRVYNNTEDVIYVHTNIGEWMAIFKFRNGLVYCDGFIHKGGYPWPSDIENYVVIERYSFVVPEPRKPNYGTSKRKDKIIADIEVHIEIVLEDFYEANEKWNNTEAYIADFYEYEDGTPVFFFLTDGGIELYPVAFEEINGEVKIIGSKGFSIDDSNRQGFERYISDAVRRFIWKVK